MPARHGSSSLMAVETATCCLVKTARDKNVTANRAVEIPAAQMVHIQSLSTQTRITVVCVCAYIHTHTIHTVHEDFF